MLASLLPGLRDVRTPLTVGYLWLFIGWAWFGDRLPRARPAGDGLIARFFDLYGVLGLSAIAVVLSFLAYLLGSLLTVPVESRLVSRVLLKVGGLAPGARRTYGEYDAFLAQEHGQSKESPTAVAFDEFASNFDISEADLRARLLVANQEMYGEYDRFAAEASFRVNLFAPLLTMAVVSATNFGSGWAVVPVIAAVVLLIQGANRLAMSNNVIQRAVMSGVIEHSRAAAARLGQDAYEQRMRDAEGSAKGADG